MESYSLSQIGRFGRGGRNGEGKGECGGWYTVEIRIIKPVGTGVCRMSCQYTK